MSEPGSEGYDASKGGIYSLTHALALSLAKLLPLQISVIIDVLMPILVAKSLLLDTTPDEMRYSNTSLNRKLILFIC